MEPSLCGHGNLKYEELKVAPVVLPNAKFVMKNLNFELFWFSTFCHVGWLRQCQKSIFYCGSLILLFLVLFLGTTWYHPKNGLTFSILKTVFSTSSFVRGCTFITLEKGGEGGEVFF